MVSISKTRTAAAALALATVFVGPALAQTGSNSGGGVDTHSKQSPADQKVAQRVYTQLTADDAHYYKHVTVTADNGVVTLGGSVGTPAALNKAKKIASAVPGVTKVVDQMSVEPGGPANAP
jgi:osmotically-inducible protein OsmY